MWVVPCGYRVGRGNGTPRDMPIGRRVCRMWLVVCLDRWSASMLRRPEGLQDPGRSFAWGWGSETETPVA